MESLNKRLRTKKKEKIRLLCSDKIYGILNCLNVSMLRTLKIFPVLGDFRCKVTPRVLSLSTRARAANDSSFNGWWEQLYTGTYFKILSYLL